MLPCLHEPKACSFDAPMRCVGLSNAAVEILMHLAFVSDGMRETPALFLSLKKQSDSIACLDMRCRREAVLRVIVRRLRNADAMIKGRGSPHRKTFRMKSFA